MIFGFFDLVGGRTEWNEWTVREQNEGKKEMERQGESHTFT